MVSVSGGKDSTVVYNLALQVARERGRLPLKVCFLDQEAEWLATIVEIRKIMYNPEVEPVWLQIPFKLFNATSFKTHWLQCWAPGEEHIRDYDPIARTENIYGTERFGELFPAILRHEFKGKKAVFIAGVRCEESPRRAQGLTGGHTYGGVTWGKRLTDDQYTLYPIYDWTYRDVWKSIHENGWSYCAIYDKMYQYGTSIHDMRVSNLHHETAVRSLFILQEMEPENYNAIVSRIEGVDMAGKMAWDDFFCPKKLPYMFRDWKEYRDFLLEKLIDNPAWREGFKKKFAEMEDKMLWIFGEKLYQRHITSILTNDWEHVKLTNIVIPREKYDEYKRREAAKAASKKINLASQVVR
jgi:predicted phosphoadenosine phosphosulfate sulfurtransferase